MRTNLPFANCSNLIDIVSTAQVATFAKFGERPKPAVLEFRN